MEEEKNLHFRLFYHPPLKDFTPALYLPSTFEKRMQPPRLVMGVGKGDVRLSEIRVFHDINRCEMVLLCLLYRWMTL